MSEVINLVPPAAQNAEEHARADTQRNKQLFDWADGVLRSLGLDKAIAAAKSIQELGRMTLDVDSADVALAIRDALHPASGQRQEHFRGLKEGGLKLILKDRFADWKNSQGAKLRRGTQPDWTDQLILNKNGTVKAILANVVLILREDPKWKNVLGYDKFNARVVIRKRPPWGEEEPDTTWTDHHESLTRVWFQSGYRMTPTMGDVGRAVQTAANHNPFHPVRDYFESLVWDGVFRLESWLQTYLHVEDSEYVRAIGARFLISVAARIYCPGAKADHVIVLEGPQGQLKSEALRTLAVNDSWFTDRLSHVGSKDAAMETSGVLIIEIAEMDALTKASSSAIKSFLTRRDDRFRPPYGKHMINLPRQCVFAGSINPTAGGYLKDPTGARQFWPVACRGMIDRASLETVRDQLWAEAVHRYKAGACWWLETPELEALATAEQAARFVVDAWEEPIREWIGDRIDVRLSDVFMHDGMSSERQTTSALKRVKAILTNMGFKKTRPRTADGRKNIYQRDPAKKEVIESAEEP